LSELKEYSNKFHGYYKLDWYQLYNRLVT
jgi:hypothetical protein